MKTILILAAGLVTFGSAHAQKLKDKDVPAHVKEAFSKKYPGAKAKWEKENADYEAEFDWNKTESSAVFDGNGAFKELEQEIKAESLPKAAFEYCNQNFAGYQLSETAKITDASGKIMYEAEMHKGKEQFDALFDEQGTFVRRSSDSGK